MRKTGYCGPAGKAEANDAYEVVRIEKTRNGCHLCEEYAERQKTKPVAVICCEGACLRGEVARQAANILCHSLAPEKTVRICLGGGVHQGHRAAEPGAQCHAIDRTGGVLRQLLITHDERRN
jgi:hypothetical protein